MDGPYVDEIPELAANILTKESAAFVDVVHTNGGFEPCVVCTNCIKFLKFLIFKFLSQFVPAQFCSWVTWTSTPMGAPCSLGVCLALMRVQEVFRKYEARPH